jgi:thiamine-phosphate pyrophosphorylase
MLLAWCDRIIEDGVTYGARVIVNDRADVAAMAGAAGVHLGQTDLSVSAARDILGPEALIGVSTHNREQIDRVVKETDAVDYLAVGPVYATVTKATGYSTVGLELVTDASGRASGRPVVAIGGITLERVAEVIDAGATSVAVISDLLTEGDPERRVADYVRVLGEPSK